MTWLQAVEQNRQRRNGQLPFKVGVFVAGAQHLCRKLRRKTLSELVCLGCLPSELFPADFCQINKAPTKFPTKERGCSHEGP